MLFNKLLVKGLPAVRLGLIFASKQCRGGFRHFSYPGETLSSVGSISPAVQKQIGSHEETSQSTKFRERCQNLIIVLRKLKQMFVDLNDIPATFVVPSTNEWPETFHGHRIGLYLCQRSQLRRFKSVQSELLDLGYDPRTETELNIAAMKRYHNLFGTYRVPYEFVIPAKDAQWEKRLWGKRLGHIVSKVRIDETRYRKEREWLRSVDPVYASSKKHKDVFDEKEIVSALQAYKKIHGDVEVPAHYVVPKDSTDFPPECWGMNLGYISAHLREGSFPQLRPDLEALGFRYNRKLFRASHVLTAIAFYHALTRDELRKHLPVETIRQLPPVSEVRTWDTSTSIPRKVRECIESRCSRLWLCSYHRRVATRVRS